MASPGWAWFWQLVQAVPATRRWFNRFLINRAILVAPPRPNPLSTLCDYSSWESLTDRRWSARHLPAVPHPADLPALDDVKALFRKAEGAAGDRRSAKSTMLFPCFAQWFTDGFLRTDPEHPGRNTSNHEIDLSPLYGLNRAETELLRSKQGGRLKSQQLGAPAEEYPPFLFEDDGATVRAEFGGLAGPSGLKLAAWLTPEYKARIFATGGDRANSFVGISMLQTLFLREHNRVADLLARDYNWDDERLFQTTRNIMIVLLIKVVVEEYINHITPYHFHFLADPTAFYTAPWYRTNRMAIEFSLVYRWHSLIPETLRISQQELAGGRTLFHNDLLVQRGLGGLFEDMSSQPSGELGLFNTPSFLLDRETSSVHIGRSNRLASYNDYRALVGFPRVTDFDQINGDPQVQAALRRVYGSVDRIEFYTGLFAEEVRPNSALPPLIGRIVGMDAFSQALTNPLLSMNVFHPDTFSRTGWDIIHETGRLADILERNVPSASSQLRAFMTQGQGHGVDGGS
jgi:prostaglandin-endoperoxide synthase 2